MGLNNELAAAVAGWREYGWLCPGRVLRDTLGMNPTLEHGAWCCNNTLYALPAEVKALIEAVTITQISEGGSLQTLRDWEEIGEGALKGRLLAVIERHDLVERIKYCFSDSSAIATVSGTLEMLYGGKP